MTQVLELSQQAKEVVNNFYNRILKENPDCNPSLILAVSLYAKQPDYKLSIVNDLKDYLIDLYDYLDWGEEGILQTEYKQVILNCLDQSSNLSVGHQYTEVTPTSLVELCLSLSEVRQGDYVYLPHSGQGEFLRKLKGCKCEANEEDIEAKAISELINSLLDIDCEIGDVLMFHNPRIGYDYVFTSPYTLYEDETMDCIKHLIPNGIKNGGKAYAVLPIFSFFNSEKGTELRAKLAEAKVSITVIILPNQLFKPGSFTTKCLLQVVNDGLGNVVLADFSNSEYISKIRNRGLNKFAINIDAVVNSLENKEKDRVWCGSFSELTSDLSFEPKRYLPLKSVPELSKGEKLVQLGDLIERVPYYKLPFKSEVTLIGNRELSSDYLNCTIDASSVTTNTKESLSVIDTDCLLIGFIGGKVKVAKLENASLNYVSLRHEVFPVRIISKEVREDYLLRAILSEYSREQLQMLSSGVVISRVKFDDLCQIFIKLPSLDTQDKICYIEAHEGIKEADLKLQKAHEEYRRDIHMKKHAIGQTIANFKNWWELLDKVRKSGVIDETAVIGKIHKVSVKEIFENIEITIAKLSTQFNKFDTGYGMSKDEFALTEFIENYIQQNKSPLFYYEYDSLEYRSAVNIPEVNIDSEKERTMSLTDSYILKKGEPIAYVKFPKEALTIIFDNIISNACAHGFDGRETEDNIVKIEINSLGTDYIVSISNNGKPLDNLISTEDVTIYGQTSGDTNKHFGIGGYEIKRLMEEFGDKVQIISNPDSEFPLTYKLIFHDTNILNTL